MGKAVARAVVQHHYDDELRTNVRVRIAYCAEVRDVWRGPWRGTYREALADARAYNAEHNGTGHK